LETADHLGGELDRGFAGLIGARGGLREAVRQARILTKNDAPVLLQGETGVGKEVFARAIHDAMLPAHGAFVAVNCGGLSRDLLASELFGYVDGAVTGARRSGMIGKVEAAHGGTLFLDEIGEMPLDLQPYLLRVLDGGEVYPLGSNQPRTVRFRLIAACNRDLRAEVNAARFRMDLYYRVSVTTLRIPPLRDRAEDLSALVEQFARDIAEHSHVPVKRFTAEVLVAFGCYPWPGNLRELRNVVSAMALLTESDVVGVDALPPELRPLEHRDATVIATRPDTGLKRVEFDAIDVAIRTHRGNLTRVARSLNISKSTLYLKVKKYALEPVVDEVRRPAR
jgi:transcriptional regulator with PAS, ATPase and Fis domain